jgi:hypothetical protein
MVRWQDENARVREAVSTLGQDKQRAEQRLQELQEKQVRSYAWPKLKQSQPD